MTSREAIWCQSKSAPTSFLPHCRLTTAARFPRCLNSWIEEPCAQDGMAIEAARSSWLWFCSPTRFFWEMGGEGSYICLGKKVLWGRSQFKRQVRSFHRRNFLRCDIYYVNREWISNYGRQAGWMDGWYEQAGGKVIPSPDQPLVAAS